MKFSSYHKIKKAGPGIAYKSLAMLCLLLLGNIFCASAQTNGPLTLSLPNITGNYSSNVSIALNTGFSSSGPFSASIQLIDCIPYVTSPTQSKNFVLTTSPRIGGYTTASQLGGQGTCQVTQTVQYFDGLGRPTQTVQVKGSPYAFDVVQPIAYDQFGRETTKYLPYALNGTTPSDGSFKTNALTPGAGQPFFYNTPPAGVAQIGTPQAVSVLEASPLNRVLEQGWPGDTWQPAGTATPTGVATGHTVKMVYAANDGTTYWAKKYAVNIDASGNRTLLDQTTFNPNKLTVTETKDENWTGAVDARLNTTETYTDMQGHVILKRTYNGITNGGVTTVQTISTYYVYDDFGNLSFVLPPAANPDGGLTSTANQTVLNNLCYQYQYDGRNRLTGKRLPGKDWELMVYNKLDQVVLNQDANQRLTNQWTVTKYDAQGRVVVTGLWNAGSVIPQSTLQTSIYAAAQWDLRDYTNNTATNPTGYVISSYPQLSKTLTVNYYDDYTFTGQPSAFVATSGASTQVTGLPTATKTAVLNTITNTTPDMLWKVSYYDDLGRTIQTYSQHYLNGVLNPSNYDVVASTYDFTNAPTTATRNHFTTANTTYPQLTIANRYLYDHMGRKLKTWEQITKGNNTANPTPDTRTLISKIDYNEIGQVMNKRLHSTDSATYQQNIAYAYNERGWLLSSTAPMFAMQLYYNTGTNKQYNGNIAYQFYGTPGNLNTSYTYTYDNLNRLTGGTSNDNYSETGIKYDLNGNITNLQRTMGSTTPIDNLTYSYLDAGGNYTNQVQSIADAAPDNSFNGYRPGTYSSYQYDANGNLKQMPTPPDGTAVANINISTYNLLNLPQSITGGRTITYTYDATGNKLRKVSNGAPNTDYISGIQYDGGTLSFIQTDEGKVVPKSAGGYDYYYYLGDNLGNTRVTFDTQSGATRLQTDDYYPFGYEISRGPVTSPKNNYLYNRKELQGELGQYDYGARFYDPVIARWGTIDPLAEQDRRWSPYNYVLNNPIRMIDPDGMGHYDSNGNWVADPTDDATYDFRAEVTNKGQTFTWMGSDAGWVAEDKKSDSELQSMYQNYVDAGENPIQGAYGNQIKEWSESPAGFKAGINANMPQLNMAAIVSLVAIEVMGMGLDVGEPEININRPNEQEPVEIGISKSKHPESAQHAEEGMQNGVDNEGIIDRPGRPSRRRDNLKDVETKPGADRDEFPPAVIKNRDGSSSVKHIDPSDNRGAGGSIGQQIKRLPNGTKVKIIVVD